MPISETARPKDVLALHNKIRGPTKEQIEAAVQESVRCSSVTRKLAKWVVQLGLTGDRRYIETDSQRTEPISSRCVVFLILGKFAVGEQTCSQRYVAYRVTDESFIRMEAYSAVVIFELDSVPADPEPEHVNI